MTSPRILPTFDSAGVGRCSGKCPQYKPMVHHNLGFCLASGNSVTRIGTGCPVWAARLVAAAKELAEIGEIISHVLATCGRGHDRLDTTIAGLAEVRGEG